MKAVITAVTFKKEWESKNGKMYGYQVEYDGKKAFYSSKSNPQSYFIKGEVAEFTEETQKNDRGEYLVIKPIRQAFTGKSSYGKAVKKEQSRYSGFAMSYAKDLVISGHVELSKMRDAAKMMFDLMVQMDQTLEQ